MYAQPETYSVCVKHTFEAAHRLPQLGGKRQNLHGHSWSVSLAVVAPALSKAGTVVEFGELKTRLREWVGVNLDHASMLGNDDPLAVVLRTYENKVFCFGSDTKQGAEALAADLLWPTVESVAVLLARVGEEILRECAYEGVARVSRVDVQETHLNSATFEPWTSW